MAGAAESMLEQTVALLAAAVIAVPVFRRLGFGSVLGYFAAGLVIGPFGLRLFDDPVTLLHVAELGVVMFLFIIGLEMRPARLWALRRSIFGLGAAQVLTCGVLLTMVGFAAGVPLAAAAVGAMGFVLSSTAVIVQTLEEANETSTVPGQRAIAILLLEDLSIIPLLALVSLWAAFNGTGEDIRPVWQSIAVALGVIGIVFAVGRWLLDPMFRVLAQAGAREVMTAAALLVVLGAALFMELGGLSMAMGAFLAGVLLSESSFRRQLETDIEPFRGILLGLFFLSVGMALDLGVVIVNWPLVLAGVAAFMVVKAFGIYVVGRLLGAGRREAGHRAALFAQGGEFAFVLYGAALAVGLLDERTGALLTAIVILSMAITPLVLAATRLLSKPQPPSLDGIQVADGLRGRVLFIGFGRFGQVVSQPLLARCVELSAIEVDVDMIRVAENFGFKVYYGDGTRLDVLHASGAAKAEAILVCVDRPEAADRIVDICKAEFPLAKLFVRAYDRGHVLRLVKAGVDYQVRETFEAALVFGHAVLRGLGFDDTAAAEAIADVRKRDEERLDLQIAGIAAGQWLLRNNRQTLQPEPLIRPTRTGERIDKSADPDLPGSEDSAA
jgi:glutathione-regulated potassium-efflux system protein KefB